MEDWTHLILFSMLVILPLWKRYGWLQVISGLSVMGIAVGLAMDDLQYGLPFVFIGLMFFILGVFRLDKTGTE